MQRDISVAAALSNSRDDALNESVKVLGAVNGRPTRNEGNNGLPANGTVSLSF